MGWRARVRGLVCAAICCGSVPAGSVVGSSIESLKACLAAFEGIAWQLPYRPPVRVHRCSWPGGGYNDQPQAQQGRSRLELIASAPMPRNSLQSLRTSDYQDAVFTHFDRLFTQHGFQRMEIRHGEQRADRFVEFAKYLQRGGGASVLTWETGGANTWVVTLEGQAR